MESLFLDPTLILIIAAFAGFFMAFGIGANDVANAMGTSVGSKAITLKQAVIIAAIFEFLGAYLAGGEVTSTIRKGIVSPSLYSNDPDIFIIGMLSALFAAGTWLFLASRKGWPVSTTHSIVGAIVGFVVISMGFEAVSWGKVGNIAASWVVSPLISGSLAFFIFWSAKKFILDKEEPISAAIFLLPVYTFFAAVIIALVTARKGLKHVGLPLSDNEIIGVTIFFGVFVTLIASLMLRLNREKIKEYGVESAFALLMIVTAASIAFAHGSNDVANAIGPVAAIIGFKGGQSLTSQPSIIPFWILQLGASGVVLGLITYGYKIMDTVGSKITQLTPSRGFVAQFTTSAIIMIASSLGLPVSTTQTMVGAILGVGIARGFMALNMKVIRGILISWFITVPAGMILAMIFFLVLQGVY